MAPKHRRDVLKTIAGTGTLLAAGTTVVSAEPGPPEGKPREGASAENTIFEIAESIDDFDTLESALEATGLDAVLDSNDAQYTVFAPTDEAFKGTDTSGLTTPDLKNVLLYHVTNGRRYAASVVNAPSIEMLNGGTVTVDGTNLNGDQADIGATNIEARNGVVHVIDGVLLP